MPKVELTMNRWGLVLRAIRSYMHEKDISREEMHGLRIAEDRIIDMAFELAKEAEDMRTSTKEGPNTIEKKFVCPVGQQI